jgi:hypothetical protein
MNLFQLTKTKALTFALLLPSLLLPVNAQSTDPTPKPDNTAFNKRDQSPGEATADQQKMNAADRALTAKIRKAVMAADSGARRKRFRGERENDSGVKTNGIPG